MDALSEQIAVHTDNLATDDRWPVLARLAADRSEVRSVTSHRLFFEKGHPLATLNLYSRKSAAFEASDFAVVGQLATHCAIALIGATVRENNAHLREALDTSRDIGAAMGILMATKLVTRDQAFDLLQVASQHSHRKLRDVAVDVADRGILPGM
jgi:GAF domain-containing protein